MNLMPGVPLGCNFEVDAETGVGRCESLRVEVWVVLSEGETEDGGVGEGHFVAGDFGLVVLSKGKTGERCFEGFVVVFLGILETEVGFWRFCCFGACIFDFLLGTKTGDVE